MLFTAKYTPEQWAEAKRLRAEGLAFPAIADQVGFRTSESIRKRAQKEGWPGGRNANAGSAQPSASKRHPSPVTVDIRRALAVRLYGIVDLRISSMELHMKKRLDAYEAAPAGTEPPMVTKEDHESFAALIENINQVTEMVTEPANAADGGSKSAINPELLALSNEIDSAGLAIASEKDKLRRDIAERLAKLFPPE